MKSVIVGSGTISDYEYIAKFICDADLIIAADGGGFHLRRMGINPHVLLGDFDSLDGKELEYFRATGAEIIKFPVQKDMSDTELAVELAYERGCRTISLLGATGTRLDHTMSNVFLLKKMLDKGINGWLINENNKVTLIKDKIEINREKGAKVSLLPITEKVSGITLQGFYYPLDNATIQMGSTLGISNEFIEEKARISIKNGLLLVVITNDK